MRATVAEISATFLREHFWRKFLNLVEKISLQVFSQKTFQGGYIPPTRSDPRTVISRYNHFGYGHKCVIITKMCLRNIGPYVNVWELVSHLAIVSCDNVFKNVI